MINPLAYQPQGDKQNSDYFEEYRIKIYERRVKSGLNDLLGNIGAVVVQVNAGDGVAYLEELHLMTPYRYQLSFESNTHKIYCLFNQKNKPVFFVLEPLNADYEDNIVRINRIYPNARKKCQARYVGEIFKTKDKNATKTILKSHSVHFYETEKQENQFYANPHFHFTRMSDFTYNRMGYSDSDLSDFAALNLGKPFLLTKNEEDKLRKAGEVSIQLGIQPLLKGLDHLAARVLSSEREDSILELLCLTNYYFWGAFDVKAMDTATSATRSKEDDEQSSPAKVISSSDTPYIINSFKNTPMPTEDYVRNYGRRLHHMAYAVIDGDHPSGVKNIDYVVDKFKTEAHMKFVSNLVGSCDEKSLRQTFTQMSQHSLLFTEYVQRCHGFQGFLNKENVTELAASLGTAGEKLAIATPKKADIIGD